MQGTTMSALKNANVIHYNCDLDKECNYTYSMQVYTYFYSFVYCPFSQRIASMNISVRNVQQLVERLQRTALYASSRRLDMVERNVPLKDTFIKLSVMISLIVLQVSIIG